MAAAWHDFGQRVDLTARIREILLNYPEGTSIFKELIQNADDAGARTVSFCLDEQQHGISRLAYNGLAALQGPALLVRNDATFSDADFESISSVGNSVKRAMSGKTGRYGIGFSAVYHLTDVPSFVSGRHLAIFDPHCKYLPNLAADNPGKRIDFVANPLGSEFPDQAAPYCAFGCDMQSDFDGTLFRFPLRSAALAADSRISTQVYTVTKMREQLETLATEAASLLLFLRNVECCEVLVWPKGAAQPQLLHSCTIQGAGADLRRQRALFQEAGSSSAILSVHQLTLRTTDHSTQQTAEHTFLVGQSNGGGHGGQLAAFAAKAAQALGAPLVPWGAVAAPLTSPGLGPGRAYCFLPLPVRTGLPTVHINGLFELSSNRRDIWAGSDMRGAGADRSEWNMRLLEEVIAPLYAHVLGQAARLLGKGTAYSRLWPMQALQPPWDRLLKGFLASVLDQPVVPSAASSGTAWLTPRNVVFADAMAARDEDLMVALAAVGTPLPALEPATTDLLLRELPAAPHLLTPAWLRQHLQSVKADGSRMQVPVAHAAALLRYAVADIVDSDAEMVSELAGLPLLPLQSGGLASLQLSAALQAVHGPSGADGRVYLAAPGDEMLLAMAQHLLLDRAALGSELVARLNSMAALDVLNVRRLTAHELPALLPVLLPAAWQSAAIVQWTPGQNGHPTEAWLAHMWTKLQDSADLSACVGWPLLPLRGGCLGALSPLDRSIIIRPGTDAEWTATLLDALEALGCRLLASQAALDQLQLSAYVHTGNGSGVLAALQVALGSGGSAHATFDRHQITHLQRRALRKLLLQQQWLTSPTGSSSLQALAMQRRHTLQRLPIFESAASAAAAVAGTAEAAAASAEAEGSQRSATTAADSAPPDEPIFMDLMGQRFIAPSSIPASALPASFVAVSDEAQPATLALLGVRRPTAAAVYRQHILPRLASLASGPREAAMQFASRGILQLAEQDGGIIREMRRLAFVSTSKGGVRAPCELYDPRVPELHGLLDSGLAFPCGPWAEDSMLAALSMLGLQTALGPAAVLQVARRVEATAADDPSAAAARGRVLLAYLDVEASRLAMHSAATEPPPAAGTVSSSGTSASTAGGSSISLNSLFSHVGTLGQSLLGAHAGSSESKSSGHAAAPGAAANAALQSELWATLRTIHWCPVLTVPPNDLLPWPEGAPAAVTAPAAVRPAGDLHLASASKSILAGECRSPALLEGLGWSRSPDPQTLAAQLRALSQKHSSSSDISADRRRALAVVVPQLLQALSGTAAGELQAVVKLLADAPVIWTGAGFTAIDKVAFRGPLSLDPWLYVIPLELAPFAPLLRHLGVAEAFSAAQYTRVLQGMAQQNGDAPLDDKSLGQALSIVQALSSMDVGGQQVFVPDDRGCLSPAADLTYNDAPWLDSAGPTRAARVVHPKISNEVADAVGVASLRRQLLAEGADHFKLEAAEAFGQSEALTTRLKHITDAYADGPGVLLELVQNADDAGASEVAFMLDGRSYPADSVLGPGMAAWQGPALCCYNNAVFSAADLRAISRIGQDTKLDKPEATGRFGLGWNAVYHFTDLPSFCSGDNIVLFDPHAKYLPGISAAQPGLRIGFERAGLATRFPDAVAPYRHFGCDVQRRFPGTFFRFPLRTDALAAASEIKHTAYSPADVMALFAAFQRQAADALLFLKSVRMLSVLTSDGASDQPRLLFRFRLSAAKGQSHPQQAVTQFVRGADREALLRRLANTTPQDLPCSIGEVAVSHEDAAGAIGVPQRWLVCAALTGGMPLQLAAQARREESRGLVPWIGAAAPLPQLSASSTGGRSVNTSAAAQAAQDGSTDGSMHLARHSAAGTTAGCGRAFVFLPLPIATGLPLHVNGCFELSSNRRELWLGTDMAGAGARRAAWNQALLRDGVAAAYAQTLQRATKVLGPTPEYYALWPAGQLSAPWNLLAEALYQQVAALPVLWCPSADGSSGRWIAPQHAELPDEACRSEGRLRAALLAAGVPLADPNMPPAVCSMLLAHAPGAEALRPALLRRRLAAPGWRFAGSEAETQAAAPLLLQQCLDDVLDGEAESVAQLAGLPLAPLADGRRGTLQLASKAGTAGMLYVASEADVALLGDAQAHLLLRASGPLQQRLADIAAGSVLNLAPLSAAVLADVFVPAMLPLDWRGVAEVQWTPGKDGQPTAETLAALWHRIAACPPADAQLFRSLPLVPVEGGRLVAPAALPVVALGAWAPGVGSALARLGCRLLDASMLPDHVLQVHQLVHPATGTGLLGAVRGAAVAAVAGSPSAEGAANEGDQTAAHTAAEFFAAAGLEAAERNQLREFMLQDRWFAHGGGLPAAAITTLKQLPIYRCGAQLPQSDAEPAATQQHSRVPGVTAQAAPDNFTSLASSPHHLPPAGTAESLLSQHHLITGSSQETAILVSHLGVPQLSVFEFATQHLLPHAAVLPAAPRDAAFVALLRCMDDAPADLRQTMSEVAFVSTATGILLSPKQLFDPRNGELAELLDGDSSFPSPAFSSDEQVLAALAQLGMRTAASLEALVGIAQQLEAAGAHIAADPVAAEAAGAVVNVQRRAAALLDHLDRAAQHEGGEGHVQLWEAVTRLPWCPVLMQPPVQGLPWPAASQTRAQQRDQDGRGARRQQQLSPVAPPRLARPPADLWLVSAGVRVVDAPEGWAPSTALAHRLGWADPPSPNVLAVQLLELGRLHGKVADRLVAEKLAGVADQLYCMLSAAMVQPTAADIIRATLDSSAWVWVGNSFALAAAAALQGIPDLVAPLRTVPADLAQRHSELLLGLGVAQEPGASQFAHALAHLAASVGGAQASERQIAAAAALAELLGARILQGEPLLDVPTVLPDADGVFAPPLLLHVNDAAWLPSDGARLVHPAVPVHAAEALGARSLRFHHQVSTDHTQQLPCPPAVTIAAALEAQQARGLEALCDIAEVAEAAGAATLELWLDCRQHPSQSMLLPGLAAFQGLAICVRIPGVCLDDKELSELQLPRQPFRLRGSTCSGGAGLLAAYTLTDLPIALPGDSLCMWDPSGRVLAPGRRPSSAGSASGDQQPPAPPQGRKFRFTGTDLPKNFPHQFAPWDFAGGNIASGCSGTLLRLALRTPEQAAAGGISKESWSEEDAAKLLGDFVAAVTPSLLFQRHLRRVRVMCFEADASEPYLMAQVATPSPSPDAKHVFEEGRRGGIAGIGDRLRAQRPSKTRLQWREVHRQEGEEAATVERWLVMGCHGAGRSADAAADRRLMASGAVPAAGVAVQLGVSGNLQIHPVSGASVLLPLPDAFSAPTTAPADSAAAAAAKTTVMPVHIAGHFLLSRAGTRKVAWQGTAPDNPAARFNLELLACVRSAWSEAFRTLLDAGAANLYALVPPAAALLARAPSGPAFLLAQQVCQDLASRQVWRLRSGRLVGAADAAFLQDGDGAGMGPAALAWLLARAPLHEAAGHVKADLEASGTTGLASLTPASVRTMLKRVMGKRGNGGSVTGPEAAELLRFCFGDIYDPEAPAAAPDSAAQTAGLEGDVAAAVAAVQTRLAGGLAAARGLLEEAQTAAQAGGLPALGAWAAQRGTTDSTASVSSSTPQQETTGARGAYKLSCVRDCIGLPAPTGSGAIVPLGSRQLFVWPPGMAPTPLDVFPPAARDLTGQFLSHNVVQQLGHHFATAVVADTLKVRPYSLTAAERHLPAILPPHWTPRPPMRTAGQVPLAARVLPWQPGQGPSQQQLQVLWRMLVALQQHHSAAAHDPAAWDALHEWGLLPLAAGGVMRMCHCALVFAPPQPPPAISAPEALSAGTSNGQSDAAATDSRAGGVAGAGGASAADMLANGIAALGIDSDTRSGSAPDGSSSSTPAASMTMPGNADSTAAGEAPASGDDGTAAAPAISSTATPAAEEVEGTGGSAAAGQAPQHPDALLWTWLTPMLLRLDLPVLHPDFGIAAPACWPAAASATEPTEDIILHKLRLCSDAGLLKTDAMTAEDRGQLLLYFAAHVPGGLQTEDADLLLRLPIFPGIAHTSQKPLWRPLTGAGAMRADHGAGTDAAVCPNEVLSAVCGDWADLPATLQDRLLQHDPALTPLYERLSVPSWTAAQLLAQGLLPAWLQLPQQVQQRVLRYVQRQWTALKLVDAVKTALSMTPFVDTGVEGMPARPDELFDPSSRLLHLVFAGQHSFPVGIFASTAWLAILREVGLKHEVNDAETFVACARRVATSWADAAVSYEPAAAAAGAMKAAELLAAHLAAKADALFAPHVFHELGNIAFVPALRAKPGQPGGDRVLACLTEAAVPADWALAWAAAPILEDLSVPPGFAWSALRLRSPPVASTVIAHLQAVGADGGEAALAAWPAGRPAPDAAFAAVAGYLSGQGLTPSQASELTMVPLVPVAAGSRLIAPGRLFARLPQNLAPFIYELPAEHRRWDQLLRTLGMRDANSPADLLQLAAELLEAGGGAVLNANERAAALQLLGTLCNDADAAQIKATRQAAARGRVPVLTADGRLAPAGACVHIGTAPRSLLRRVDARRLAVAHPKLGPAIAKVLHIPPLEQVVVEVLDSFGTSSDNELQSIQDIPLASARERLQLPAFAAAVCDVLHASADAVPSLQPLPAREVAARLGKLAGGLRFVERCYTRVVRRSDGAEAGDALKVPFFVDVDGKTAVIAAPPPGVPAATVLAAAISAALGSPLPLPLQSLLAADAALLPGIAAELAPGGLSQSTGGLEVDRLAGAGQPGTPLLAADAACAQLRPLRPFCAGELCAYAPEHRGGQEQQLLYGRVTADARPPAGQPLHRVPLEVAPGKYAELLSTQVWCFSGGSGSPTAMGSTHRDAAVWGTAHQAASPAATGDDGPAGAAASVPAAGVRGDTAPAAGPAAAARDGNVSAAEAAAAVSEMLAAAGLPAGADSRQLLAQALALRTEKDELRLKASQLQQDLSKAAEAADAAAAAWQCRICLGAQVDAAMKECGHTLCRGCAASVPGRCAFCRRPGGVLRIFNG